MQALTYTPTLAKYVATKAGLPGAGALELSEIRLVWIRRPGSAGTSADGAEQYREWASVTWMHFLSGLWSTLDCLWVPGTFSAQVAAGQKVSQLARAAHLGFEIPRTLTTNDAT